MNCTIEWNRLGLEAWQERFARIRRSTLLQDYDNARAVCPLYGQRGMWGLIKIDGVEAGLVQMLEARLFGRVLHAMTIDRGPLWFEGFGGVAQIRAFFDTVNTQFPARVGRRRRIIPELPNSPTVKAMLEQAGLKYQGPDYSTIWLDLRPSLEDLRAGLKSNWRNHLNKAERGPLTIDWSSDSGFINEVVQGYVADRIMRPYPGPDAKAVKALANTYAKAGTLILGRALLNDKTVAALLVLCHGCAATYQIGWSDMEGRQQGGHYRLLWAAIEKLKSNDIKDFDLGGIHDDGAAGVSSFKDGMGGTRVTLSGLYR
jgi:hypothetical protein